MMQQITYDETAIASPGDVDVGPLGVELSRALGVGSYVTWDKRADVGAQIVATYDETLTAPQVATALAVVLAHDASAYADLGQAVVFLNSVVVTPASNAWVSIAGATLDLAEGRKIDGGKITITSRVGPSGSVRQGGAYITFDAQREMGGDLEVAAEPDRRGDINGYGVRLVVSGSTMHLEIRRRGSDPITTDGRIEYTRELL